MPTVLLVDDSPVVRHVLARQLKAQGFEVREEPTASSARTIGPAPLACAVVDLELPDGDGPDLVAALRAARPTLPVAFFTAGASASLVERARAYGAVFPKPDTAPVVAWVRRVAQPPPTK
jgi:CheY-like chemotaxis protein